LTMERSHLGVPPNHSSPLFTVALTVLSQIMSTSAKMPPLHALLPVPPLFPIILMMREPNQMRPFVIWLSAPPIPKSAPPRILTASRASTKNESIFIPQLGRAPFASLQSHESLPRLLRRYPPPTPCECRSPPVPSRSATK